MNPSRPIHRLLRYLLLPLLGVAISLSALPVQAQKSGNTKAAGYYEDALGRYDRKDYPGAIIQLKNALQIDPNMLPVQLLLGKALMENSEVAAAEVAFKEALRLGVNRAEVVVPLGQAVLAQGKHRALLDDKLFTPQGLPPDIQLQTHLLRAQAQADLGDMAAAVRSVEEARAIDKRSLEAWLAEVPIRIRAGQFKEAAMAADTAVSIAPESASAQYQKGAAAHVQGNLGGAKAAYDRAVQLDSKHADARVARAGIAIDEKRYADAAGDLAALKTFAPQDPRGAYMRALIAERNRDRAASQTALKEVTDLIDPVPIEFIRYKPQMLMLNGLAHFGLAQNEKAKQYLEAFLRVQRASPVSKLLARIYMGDGNLAMAIDVLEPYLRAQPGDGQALTLLANAHMAAGRNAKAAALMEQALKAGDNPAFRTTLGLSLIGDGKTANGVAELEAAYRKNPRQTQAAIALVNIYLQTSQSRKAIPLAEQLVKLQASNPTYHNLLGMARGQSGDAKGARAAFEKALALDKGFHQASLNLARVDIAARAYDEATARLDNLLKATPNDSEALYELAVIAERKGNQPQAQRWIEKARDAAPPTETRWDLALMEFHLRHDAPGPALDAAKSASSKKPDNLGVLLAYTRAQLASGDTIAAKSALSTATRIAEYDAPAQVQIASLQLSANNPAGASYSLEKALSSRPNYLPALAKMAEVELRKGDHEKAEKLARNLTVTEPRLPIGFQLLGDIAMARKQSGNAIDAYRKAHQIEPNTASLLRLFRAMTTQENARPALQLAEQWLKTYPSDISVQKALADGYARAGEFKAARAAYEAALKLQQNDAEALNNLANVLIQLKDPQAVRTAEAALASAPGNSTIIDTLGWALFQNGQHDRALQMLRDARLRQPGNPEIRYHLAAVLAQVGRKNEARDELRVALQTQPAFEARADAEKLMRTLN